MVTLPQPTATASAAMPLSTSRSSSSSLFGLFASFIIATMIVCGVVLLFLLIAPCLKKKDNAWHWRLDEESVTRRVREGYGNERSKRSDRKLMARNGWTLNVEVGNRSRTTDAGGVATQPRSYVIPKPATAPTTSNISGSSASAPVLTAERTTRYIPYSSPFPFPSSSRSLINETPRRNPVPAITITSVPSISRNTQANETSEPAYTSPREEAEQVRQQTRNTRVFAPPAYTPKPRDGEVIAERSGSGTGSFIEG